MYRSQTDLSSHGTTATGTLCDTWYYTVELKMSKSHKAAFITQKRKKTKTNQPINSRDCLDAILIFPACEEWALLLSERHRKEKACQPLPTSLPAPPPPQLANRDFRSLDRSNATPHCTQCAYFYCWCALHTYLPKVLHVPPESESAHLIRQTESAELHPRWTYLPESQRKAGALPFTVAWLALLPIPDLLQVPTDFLDGSDRPFALALFSIPVVRWFASSFCFLNHSHYVTIVVTISFPLFSLNISPWHTARFFSSVFLSLSPKKCIGNVKLPRCVLPCVPFHWSWEAWWVSPLYCLFPPPSFHLLGAHKHSCTN